MKEHGQQGTGDVDHQGERRRNYKKPVLLSSLPEGLKVADVSCGFIHTILTTTDGACWTMGWGSSGVLGHGDKVKEKALKRVSRDMLILIHLFFFKFFLPP
jgi:alpha-tubulin suppressor-like RCC1 family protein